MQPFPVVRLFLPVAQPKERLRHCFAEGVRHDSQNSLRRYIA